MIDTSAIPWPWLSGVIVVVVLLLGVADKFKDSPVINWISRLFRWLGRKQYERDNRETILLRNDVNVLDAKVEAMASKLDWQAVEIAIRDDYIVYVAEWSRDVRILVAALVPPMTIPDLRSFKEWKDTR